MLNNLFAKKNQDITQEADSSSLGDWLQEQENDKNNGLALDVYQTAKNIVIKSIIPGLKPEDLKISLHNDLLTIKGACQQNKNVPEDDYFYKECYWGPFSRSLILPHEVDNSNIEAVLEDGILTITLHKTDKQDFQITIRS